MSTLPSIRALSSSDEALLANEFVIVNTRRRAASLRALLDEVDRVLPSLTDGAAMDARLADQIVRLAYGLLDATRLGNESSSRADDVVVSWIDAAP